MADTVLAVDCGTHAVRTIAFKVDTGAHHLCASEDLPLSFPQPGWVEIDPELVVSATARVLRAGIDWAAQQGDGVVAVGLTNMRETAFAWRRSTGQPVHPGIMWMSQQSDPIVDEWKAAGLEDLIRSRTGLVNHSFFFGSKVAWLLRNDARARQLAEEGDLAVGTLDSWLLYRLTGGAVHATDVSNASRYQLMGLADLAWDDELCEALGIPRGCLPEIRPSEGHFGVTDATLCGQEVPITGVVADQQASLLGHGCEDPGDVKVTFGTSGVVALNVGSETPLSTGLLTSVAWTDRAGRTTYEMEGSAFHSGYTLQWLIQRFGAAVLAADGMGPSALAPDERVYLLPSFTTLGAPRWTPRSGAVITGLGMDTQTADIMRAGVEAMAFQAYDLFAAMDDGRDGSASDVAVDGGGATNDYLCQMLADLLARDVVRPALQDITSAGAAKAALAGAGHAPDRWFGQDRGSIDRFEPGTGASYAREGYQRWVDLVETVLR